LGGRSRTGWRSTGGLLRLDAERQRRQRDGQAEPAACESHH
jgi:hypothetical protein